MKNEKLSIDALLVLVFCICFFVLFTELYVSNYNFFLQNNLKISWLNSFLVKVNGWLPLHKNAIVLRLACTMIIAFTTLGFKIKLTPSAENKLYQYIAYSIVSCFVFVIIPSFDAHIYFNACLSFIAFTTFMWAFINTRKHFDYFESKDEFNDKNQIFLQSKKIMENEYSVNFKTDNGTINVVNPFRATMVLGTPGSGKSYSVIEEYIRQHIQKHFTMMVYDFKFPSLAKETYAFYEFYKETYEVEPNFTVISLDDLEQSSFINPIGPKFIRKAADAIEASQTVLYNLNKEWIEKKDFFAQSAISYFACCIYFLKIYEEGKYCTLPHAISLASCPDEDVFKIFKNYPELKFFMTPFADALAKEAFEQLAGQTASARIPLSQLATKELFWVMGNNVYPELNVPLDINNPENPTIFVLANSPMTQTTNSPALGLISTQMLKEINKQGQQPCSVIIDELPTMYFMGLDNLIATARSNKISTTIGMQDLEQLKRDYGEKVAAVIFNIVGNVFSGSVRSETATKLQDMFGKKKQKLKNVTVESEATSYTINENLEFAIPNSTISQLSQGEFVGVVADNFGEEIDRKIFRGKIKVPERVDQITTPLPIKVSEDSLKKLVDGNFNRIVDEIDILVNYELDLIQKKEEKEKPSANPDKETNTNQENNPSAVAG